MTLYRFSQDIRVGYPSLTKGLDEFEAFLPRYEERFRESFFAENTPDGPPIDQRITLVLLSYLARARQLTWVIVHCVNAHLGSGLFLGTRAHLEVTAGVGYLLKHFQRLNAGETEAGDFSTTVNRLFLAKRFGIEQVEAEIGAQGKAISVLTLLDYVDREPPAPELKGALRETYEWLSEFCHPNAFSRMIGSKFDAGQFTFDRFARLSERELSTGLSHAAFSQVLFFSHYDDCANLLEELYGRKL